MHFRFVDKITNVGHRVVDGERFFSVDETFQYASAAGDRLVYHGAIAEAIGQLVSWHCLVRNDFTAKPIFLFAESISVFSNVTPGSHMILHAEVDLVDDGVVRYTGTAYCMGRLVMTIDNCHMSLVPLASLNDPEDVRRSFLDLRKPNRAVSRGASQQTSGRFVGATLKSMGAETVVASRRMMADEPFYGDHFPRFPITPAVILFEMISTATEHLVSQCQGIHLRPKLRAIRNPKVKHFVRPGDHCVVTVKVEEKSPEGEVLRTTAGIQVGTRHIMKCGYEYGREALIIGTRSMPLNQAPSVL